MDLEKPEFEIVWDILETPSVIKVFKYFLGESQTLKVVA